MPQNGPVTPEESPNLPEASQPPCRLTYSLFVILLSSYSNPAVSDCHQRQYMSNTAERSKLSNGFVFLERLLPIHIIVFHLICVQGKMIFFGLKLQHVISCTLFRFLILDLTHQRFKEGHDPLQCDKCHLRSLIQNRRS